MDLLGLLGGGSLPGTDGPDRLIGQNNLAPVGHVVRDGLQLPETHFGGLASLSLLQLLPDARDHIEAGADGKGDLLTNELVGLAEHVPALGVAKNNPITSAILDHSRADLA